MFAPYQNQDLTVVSMKVNIMTRLTFLTWSLRQEGFLWVSLWGIFIKKGS